MQNLVGLYVLSLEYNPAPGVQGDLVFADGVGPSAIRGRTSQAPGAIQALGVAVGAVLEDEGHPVNRKASFASKHGQRSNALPCLPFPAAY